MVIGIITKPANTRAVEPVRRFVRVDGLVPGFEEVRPVRWTDLRRISREAKYIPLPTPVRIAEGVAPRHNVAIGEGEDRIVRMVVRRRESCDCCTRVLRRSAGWRITAETTPPARPEEKCLRLFARVRPPVVVGLESLGPPAEGSSFNGGEDMAAMVGHFV
ncbi:hypothetical protein ABW19_dt0200124 [Dactylella cylindrospora]|nr:hypothetical protein ABW19_dt0200124 [Dactylella cylindrospora]